MNSLAVYLTISLILFLLGLLAIMTRKNAISVLMGIELILNSAGLNFVAFSRFSAGNLNGQTAAIFIVIVAAAEAAVALAIFLNLYRLKATAEVDKANQLQG
ncbi:MAG: NADH-quinone oxidoreductase subunit NuoK [Calditrichota bacterium]